MVPSIFIVDQKILQSDWMRDTTGHIQPQSSSLRGYFPLIFSTDIDDQRILQSNLMTSTTGHIQSKHAPFLHDYVRAKNWLIPSREINDPRILQSDWIRGRIDQPPPPKKVVSNAAFPWWLTLAKKLRCHLNLSWGIDGQKSCNLIGREAQLSTTNQRGSPRCYLCLMAISMKKTYENCGFLPEILMIRESFNLIWREEQPPNPT